MPAHVFALVNQKGGIGKTTISAHLGAGLRNKGYKVLMIDMDAQCNLTFTLGGRYTDCPTVLEAIFEEVNVVDAIQHLSEVDLIAGSANISTLEQQIDPEGKEYFLKETIKPLLDMYDYIIIDSPPTISLLTIGVMTAADSLIVPVRLDIYSLQGTGQLYKAFATVKKYCNKKLVIDGIVINGVGRRLKNYFLEVAEVMKCQVFKTTLLNSPYIQHSTIKRQTVYKYAPKSEIRKQFDALIDEILLIRNGKEN